MARVAYWGRPDCKLWSCPDCAEVNKRRWTAIVAEGIKAYQEQGITEWKFVTITTRADRRGFQPSLADFRKRWPKLHERMKRKWGKNPYVLLPERHIDGTMHMHGLFAGGVTTRWVKDNCASCGLGYMGEAKPILSIGQACFYVLKYATKSIQNGSQWPKSLHRVRTSQKWPKKPLESQISLPVALKPMKPEVFQASIEAWITNGFQIVNFAAGQDGTDRSLMICPETGELVTDWSFQTGRRE